MASLGIPDDERRTSSIDHLICDSRELIDLHDAFYLSEEPDDQPEIATGHAKNGPDSLRVSEIIHIERQPKLHPPPLQDENYFILPKRFVLMGKPNTAVKLRIPAELLFHPRHTNKNQCDLGTVMKVPQILHSNSVQAF